MKILYLSSASDWHIDLWTQYFTKEHNVFLFSDKENYLNDQPFKNVTVIKSNGLFGAFLNYFKIGSSITHSDYNNVGSLAGYRICAIIFVLAL